MIDLSGTMGIPLLKKSRFTGSSGPVRYVLEKCTGEDGDRLGATFWVGENCSDATAEEDKTTRWFSFDEQGLKEAQSWLNEQQESVKQG